MANIGKDGMHLIGPVVCRMRNGVSRGIWYGDNPLDYPFTIFLMQMICMSLVSQLIYYVLRPLKQTKFVCYSLSGIFVGPHVMGRSRNILESENYYPVETICLRVSGFLGGIYLVFLVAVKVDVGNVRKALTSASILSLTTILCSFATLLALSFLVELPNFPKENWFHGMFAFVLSVTRLPSVVYTFDELNILSSELAQLAMSTSVLNEFLSEVWLLIDLSHRHRQHLVGAVLTCLLFILFMVYTVRPIFTWIIRRTPDGKRVSEVYIVLILIGALVGALVADIIGSVQIGVIVMGLVVPNGPPLGSTLTDKVEFFVLEILLPMMYMVLGYDTYLYSIDFRNLTVIVIMIFIGLAAKIGGTFLTALARGIDSRHALLLGLMLNMKGPFDIVPFVNWKVTKKIDNGFFAALVVSQLMVTAIAAPIIAKLYGSSVRVNTSEIKKNMRAIQSIPFDGELRVICCVYGEEHVVGLINLLHATNLPIGPLCAYIVQVSELSGRAIPTIEPHGKKKQHSKITSRKMKQIMQVTSTWTNVQIATSVQFLTKFYQQLTVNWTEVAICTIVQVEAFDNYLNPSKTGSLIVKAYNVTAPYKSMHEYICKLALDEKTPLIIVPFPDATTQQFETAEAAALRHVNINVQLHAPCTVGILVDRNPRFSTSSSTSPRKIAVLFFGGADDREALSMGIRMASHPTVSVTLFRLISLKRNSYDLEEQAEEKLDQEVINDFKMKNAFNFRSLYYESVVTDAEQAMDAVRPLKNKYDLIILGCQGQGAGSMFHEILQWSENPELGVVGDFVASRDFSNGFTSVLVMQHYGDTEGTIPYKNEEHIPMEESRFYKSIRIA